MKVKIVRNEEKCEWFKETLEVAAFTINHNATTTFVDYSDKHKTIIVKKDKDFYRVHVNDVFLIKTFG